MYMVIVVAVLHECHDCTCGGHVSTRLTNTVHVAVKSGKNPFFVDLP